MDHLTASEICIVDGVDDSPALRARAERLMKGIRAERVRRVSDEELNELVRARGLNKPKRHGMGADFRPVIVFNRLRLDDPPEVREARKSRFPALFENPMYKFSGCGGFDWRDTGSPAHRAKTGLVCQPAWQLHTIVGCPFRCAYCSLGYFYNIMLNVEEFVARLDEGLLKDPNQTLYQYDNWTDTVCFEPEYGGAKLMVEYFAGKPGRYLELYVGKSDNVDFLLELDHRGHTVVCWSVSGQTQSTRIERGTGPMARRIKAARKCQQAGYRVRFRLSPIVPVRNWQAENRELIERLFAATRPDIVTFEPLRFLDYAMVQECLDTSLLDPEFLEVMKDAQGKPHRPGGEIPDDYRKKVSAFIIAELERVSPETPYAFCREARDLWDHFALDFSRHGQSPDNYVCNCGPTSAPGNPLLR